MRIRLVALIVMGYLVFPALVKADGVIYTFNQPGDISWSFEVPAIITSNTTVTSFLNTNIVTGGFFSNLGCTAITGVAIQNPAFSPEIETFLSGGPGCQNDSKDFLTPITSFGTFPSTSAALTISPAAVTTPEPSSLLLLGFAFVGTAGAARRKLARNGGAGRRMACGERKSIGAPTRIP